MCPQFLRCVPVLRRPAMLADRREGGKLSFADLPLRRQTAENFLQEVPTMRVKITLACTECKNRNYVSKKNKKNDPDRIEMKKHCKFCRKHTLHKETK